MKMYWLIVLKNFLKVVFFSADRVQFEYLVLDKEDDSCTWENKIDEDEGIPAIIKMSIEIDDENIEKFIFIPLQRASK